MRRGLASGPIVVPASSPSPTFTALACGDEACRRTGRRRFSCTSKRVGETQTCPALRNFAGRQQPAGRVDIGVVEHDRRRVAAELHRDPLHVRAGDRGELLADRGRAGERHLADDRMRDQVLGNLRRHAVDQVDHARRHAGIGEAADQFGGRGRRFLRRLDDDRAAGGERARTACAPPG